MNRRDAFKAIGAALVGTSAANAEVKLQDTKPQMAIVTFSEEMIEGISQPCIDQARAAIKRECKKAGWGDDFPVIFAGPGMKIDFTPDPQVVIPPDTIVECLDGYVVIYPVGHPPHKRPQS